MITIYKKKAISDPMQLISLNDVYFNKYTVEKLDEKAAEICALSHSGNLKNTQ